MGYNDRKPLPLPDRPPRITREQYYYMVALREAINYDDAGDIASSRKRSEAAKREAKENPPPAEWRDDEARAILEMFEDEEDFSYWGKRPEYRPFG